MELRRAVKVLLDEGLSVSAIARRLHVARPTVEYHVKRIRTGAAAPPVRPEIVPDGTGHTRVPTRERVSELLERGWSRGEIARALGITKATVSYHARRLGAPVDERGARRYDWDLVQRFYDEGHSVRECQTRFGFSRQTWHAAINRGAVKARPNGLPMDELLVNGVDRARNNLKLRLIRAGIKKNRCEECGIEDWLGLPLALALHHVNGDRRDNRLGNLRLLCPNCHSQTDTFAGRNPGIRESNAP
jgi:DNA-binding CsgD family transcriptional regulator